ncbi:MAG: PEP-CTERM sorting domain-containing protein [Alphaproteobacteria bacterium]
MARRHFTILALKTTLAALALLAAALPSPARADLISELVYSLTICGGSGPPQPGSPCYVEQAQAPIPSLDGLDEAIQEFYDPYNPAAPLYYGATGANASGYTYGSVTDGNNIHAQFVFYQGAILCCTKDFPYLITGLNDNGIFIGNYPGQSFVSSLINQFEIGPQVPTLDAPSIALLESMMPTGYEWEYFWFDIAFWSIDNENRISGDSPFGSFVLTPIPEPASGLLILTALAGLFATNRNRTVPTVSGPCRA